MASVSSRADSVAQPPCREMSLLERHYFEEAMARQGCFAPRCSTRCSCGGFAPRASCCAPPTVDAGARGSAAAD
eukprot:359163-Prymnesium_polylepis.1